MKMQPTFILAIVACLMMAWQLGEAQKSFYAGGTRSRILPRFTVPPEELANREGEGFNQETTTAGLSGFDGTLHDRDTIKKVSEWPEDRQPFWFKNRDAIAAQRGQDVDGGNIGPATGTRFSQPPSSPFLGQNRPSNQFDQEGNRNRNRQPPYPGDDDTYFLAHKYYNNFEGGK